MAGHRSLHPKHAGATVVEFAIVLLLFLTFVFVVMEVARVMYLFNILQEVTRRAAQQAAVTDFNDADAKAEVRRSAVFNDPAGQLIMGAPVTDAHVRIDYLAVTRNAAGGLAQVAIPAASLPASPARNKANCINNPYGADCIRLVRARICDPGNADACEAVAYVPAFPLVSLELNLPLASTIVRAESLGFVPGSAP